MNFTAAERQAARQGWGWWSMAENPPCVEYCLGVHDPDEFMVCGTLLCSRPFGDAVTVWWSQEASRELPFLVESDEPEIQLETSRHSSLADAEGVVAQIQAAVAFVRAL